MRSRTCVVVGLAAALLAGAVFAQSIPNWSAPPTWTPSKGGMTASAMSDLSNPVPFIPVTPCRVADTRGNGFTGAYGTPSLVAFGTRDFTIADQCGIPSGAVAVSFNFTIVNGTQAGDLRFYPTGGSMPLVSTINWGPTTGALANAAVVPLGGGAITVKNDSAAAVDLIIDVNGYYSGASASGNGFNISSNTGGFGLSVTNSSTTCGGTCAGVFFNYSDNTSTSLTGYSTSLTGVNTGVEGVAYGIAGSYGVLGTVNSPSGQSAGVEGMAGAVPDNFWGPSGVRGIGTNFGVLGISTLSGVGGFKHDSSGAMLSGSYLGYSSTIGLYTIGTTAATGAKNFVEPDPLDPTRTIRFSSLEGNEVGTYFRGKGQFMAREAVITVPEDFRLVTESEGLSIQVTPIGDLATVAVVSIGLDEIVLRASRDVEFFYTVNGVRKGYADFKTIENNASYFVPDSPAATMPASLSAEAKQRLIASGVYHEDGTVNMETAARVGWVKMWQDREEKARAAAALALKAQVNSKP